MRSFPSNLTSAFADVTKEPRYIIRFLAVDSVNEYPFSADFATGPVSYFTTSFYPVMDWPRGNTQTIELEMGRSTIGQLQFSLLDGPVNSYLITQYMANPGAGLTSTISDGNATVPASISGGLNGAYPPFGTIELRGSAVAAIVGSLTATASTVPSSVDVGVAQAFRTAGYARLSSIVGAGLTSNVSLAQTYLPASIGGGLTAYYLGSGTVTIQSEQITYTTLTDSTFGSPTSAVVRAVAGTTAVSYAAPMSCQQQHVEWIYYSAVTNSTFGTTTSPVSRGVLGTSVGTAGYPHAGISSIDQPISERMRYTSVTGSLFSGLTRGVDGTKAIRWAAPNSVQNGEQIRPGTRVQLFVGDSSVPFSAYASYVKMEVFNRHRDGPTFSTIECQDALRFIRRYAFVDAGEPTNSADYTIVRSGRPLDLLLQVWTTTSGGGNGPYDLGDGRGAALPQNLVTVNSIVALQSLYYAGDTYVYKFRSPIDVKQWSEELLRGLNCYTVVTGSGQLTVKRYAASGTATGSLTMDTIVGVPRWLAGDQSIANIVSVLYDFAPFDRGSDYATRDIFVDTESARKYGRRAAATITMPGVRTSVISSEVSSGSASAVLSGAAIALDRATRFLETYSEPLDVLAVEAHYSTIHYEPGDVLSVTHSHVPDVWGAGMGVSGMTFAVLDTQPVFSPEAGAPRMGFRLLRLRQSGPPSPGPAVPAIVRPPLAVSAPQPAAGSPTRFVCSGAISMWHIADGQMTATVSCLFVSPVSLGANSQWVAIADASIQTSGGSVHASILTRPGQPNSQSTVASGDTLQVRLLVDGAQTFVGSYRYTVGTGPQTIRGILITDVASLAAGVHSYEVQYRAQSYGARLAAVKTEMTLVSFVR